MPNWLKKLFRSKPKDQASNCSVEVTNVPPQLTEEALEDLFKNKKKTGGGPVFEVTKISECHAVIKLKKHKDAKRLVLRKEIEHEGDVMDIKWCTEVTVQSEETKHHTQNENLAKKQLLKWLVKNSTKIKNGNPETRQLKLVETAIDKTMLLKKAIFGKENHSAAQDKIIMVVGATGAGKTTLINGMINYVFGIEWGEPYRFKLITEDSTDHNQAESQTKHITAYTMHHRKGFAVPYSLTIIDTPGFGDTGGIERDRYITKQIKYLFSMKTGNGITHIDSICFVTQSSLPRLTPTQTYVFDQILSLFGKDIKDNIQIMLTFCDAEAPQALAALKKANIPYENFFKFNNSAIFVQQMSENTDNSLYEFNSMFWKMGMLSFQQYMSKLNGMGRKSLLLTQDVLKEREKIQVNIYNVQTQIKFGLEKLESLDQLIPKIEQAQTEIEANKDYVIEITVPKILKRTVPHGQFTTICTRCHFTCHASCVYANDSDKQKCCAMDGTSQCTECPGKCHWSNHANLGYTYEHTTVKERTTIEKLKQQYQGAQQNALDISGLINEMHEDFQATQLRVMHMTDEVRKSVQRLDIIALKPNPMSSTQYIDILINAEESEMSPGHSARIVQLKNVRKEVEWMENIATQNKDPFEAYKKKIGSSSQKVKDALTNYQQNKKPGFWQQGKSFFGF